MQAIENAGLHAKKGFLRVDKSKHIKDEFFLNVTTNHENLPAFFETIVKNGNGKLIEVALQEFFRQLSPKIIGLAATNKLKEMELYYNCKCSTIR